MRIRQLAAIGTVSSLLALSACISAPSGAQMFTKPAEPAHSPPKVQIMGHRGTTVDADENTLAAFKYARPYADILEGDVRLTRDGKMVIIHDRTLDRTTNCRGKVSGRSLASISRCTTPSGQHPPSLQQLLRWAGAQPDEVELHLELKGTWTQKQVTRFVKATTKHDNGSVTATSFSLGNLEKVDRANNDLDDAGNPGKWIKQAFIERGDPAQPSFRICERVDGYYNSLPYLKKTYVDELQQVCNPPTTVNVYGGLNSAADYEKALDTGAQVMVVEDPKDARRWLKSR